MIIACSVPSIIFTYISFEKSKANIRCIFRTEGLIRRRVLRSETAVFSAASGHFLGVRVHGRSPASKKKGTDALLSG
jgi:hypothetical protein